MVIDVIFFFKKKTAYEMRISDWSSDVFSSDLGWVGSRFESLTLTHDGGHLWSELIGWTGDPHLSPFHLASYVFIGGGFWAIAAAWPVLLRAAKHGALATTGLYGWVRHPQYVGFLAIMIGFLLTWPTFTPLVMFPVLL